MFENMIDLMFKNEYDVYAFDTAPTANARRLLSMSKVYSLWVNKMLKSREEAKTLREMLSFTKKKEADPLMDYLLTFRDRMEHGRLLLTDPEKTSFFFITLPEELRRRRPPHLASLIPPQWPPPRRQRPPIAGLDVAAASSSIMIPPVSVCHQLSWIGRPRTSFPHRTASGLSGSPTLPMNRSRERFSPASRLRPGLHEHPNGRGRRVPDGDPFPFEDFVPPLGVEVRLVDDARDAVREGSDDPVGSSRDPAGIGRAPEDVLRVEVQGEGARHVMNDDGLVNVDGALRLSGRAAGEVEQGHVLRAVSAMAKPGFSAARSAPRSIVPETAITAPSEPTSRTCSSRGSAARSAATFLAYRRSVVTRTFASPRESRWRIGSGPKAEKRGQKTPPAFSVPSAAT